MDSFLLENAPARGYFLAYYPDALVFEPYEMKDGMLWFAGCEAYRGETPRECHLFDKTKSAGSCSVPIPEARSGLFLPASRSVRWTRICSLKRKCW